MPFLRRFLKAQDPTKRILFDLGEAAGIVSAFEAGSPSVLFPGEAVSAILFSDLQLRFLFICFFCKAARRCFLGDLGRGDYFLRVFGVLRTRVLSWLYVCSFLANFGRKGEKKT